MDELSKIDLMAINFVAANGQDSIGMIDTEEKFAAAMVYISLEKRGLLSAERTGDGPIYRVTDAGKLIAASWGSV